MRTNAPLTPLLAILRAMTPDQREEFALVAGTSVSYLYQLAGCNRKSCRAKLAKGISHATGHMHRRYDTPTISMEALAGSAICRMSGNKAPVPVQRHQGCKHRMSRSRLGVSGLQRDRAVPL